MTVALEVSIPQRTYEFARGDNITIPCSFKPKNPVNDLVIISWLAEADKPGEPEVIHQPEITLISSDHIQGVSTIDPLDKDEQ
jgi:hypothetical protein